MAWLTNFITSHISKEYTEKIIEHLKGLIHQFLSKHIQSTDEIINEKFEEYKKETDKKFEGIIQCIKRDAAIHIIKGGRTDVEIKGVVHEIFDDVLTSVYNNIPVFLSGPAGCGKNHLCKQIAEALGLNFYFTNAVTQEYRLTGFIDANGKYHETEFYKACTQGGLFMLDEIDGSIPEVLILLNAAIANRYFDFPTGRVELHPDFRIIAAGNTTGNGGNSIYTGRTRLDGASLDRFLLIKMGYSNTIENAITGNNNELLSFIYCLRNISDILISYRALSAITLLEDSLSITKVLSMSITKGMSPEAIRKVQNKYNQVIQDKYSGNNNNKYAKAFLSL